MDLFEIERQTKLLMTAHGLVGWTFEWDNAQRRFGQTRYSTRTISLSRKLTPQRSMTAIRNTVLHEIAHALVGPGHGHNEVWRTKAISIGCDGKRCSNDQVKVSYKYVAKCPFGHVAGKYLRKPRTITRKSCGKCSSRYDARYALALYSI